MAVYKFENCEHNEGLCDDKTCVGEVDNCRVGNPDVIIAELVKALKEAVITSKFTTMSPGVWEKWEQVIAQAQAYRDR